jgi:hypothetical protein
MFIPVRAAHVGLAILLFLCALWTSPYALASRQVVVIVGVAEEGSGAALSDARVSLTPTAKHARTDAIGRAVLRGVDSGRYELAVSHIGHAPLTTILNVGRSDSMEVVVFLARAAVPLAPLEVHDSSEVPLRVPSAMGFYRRYKAGIGRFLTRQQLDSLGRDGAHIADVVGSRFPGLLVQWNRSRTSVALMSARGPSSLRSAGCEVRAFLDGMQISGDQLAGLRAAELGAVEYFSAGAPPEFVAPGATCGVLLLWRPQ